jgi:hypothetical protein
MLVRVLFMLVAKSRIHLEAALALEGERPLLGVAERCANELKDGQPQSNDRGGCLPEIFRVLFVLTDARVLKTLPGNRKPVLLARTASVAREVLLHAGESNTVVGAAVDALVNMPLGYARCVLGRPSLSDEGADEGGAVGSTVGGTDGGSGDGGSGGSSGGEGCGGGGSKIGPGGAGESDNQPAPVPSLSPTRTPKRNPQPGAEPCGGEARLSDSECSVADAMVNFLGHQLELTALGASQTDVDGALCPVLTTLRLVASDVRAARRYLRAKLLPRKRNADRTTAPGKGDGLDDHVIRLMMSSHTNTNRAATELLLALCNDNASRLVRRVGFGTAAGFLAARGILQAPTSGRESDSDTESDDDEAEVNGRDNRVEIDPITGGARVSGGNEGRGASAMAAMSDEEKEVAAHELLVLMDKMNKLGIIKTELPSATGGAE